MNIAIILQDLRGGGAEKMMVRLANALQNAENNITIILLTEKGINLSFVNDRVNLVHLGCSRSILSILPLAKHLRSAKYDVILSALTHINVIAIVSKILSFTKSNLFVSERNHFSKDKYSSSSTLIKLAYNVAPFLYERFSEKIICVSKGVADDLKDNHNISKDKLAVCDNPVLEDDYSDSEARYFEKKEADIHKSFTFVAVGRLAYQKGFDVLIKSFAKLNCKKTNLIIFGEGPLEKELKDLVKDLKCENRVSFPGYTKDPIGEIAKYDCFVLSSRYEGSPNVLVEALSTGIRVISTDCPSGPNEVITSDEIGYLVPVDSETELLAAMNRAIAIDNEYEKISSRIRAVEKFRSSNSAMQYISVFNSVGGAN